MEKKFVTKTGGCICGEITFKVKLDEVPRVFNCHCVDCRKKIGGMITIIDLREGAIDIDKTKLGIFEHKAGSGQIIKKHYCKKCAAPVLTYVEKYNIENIFSRSRYMAVLTYIQIVIVPRKHVTLFSEM